MTDEASNGNPYVGLRPYRLGDYERFFGRREQVSELLATMRHGRFVAVVGSSGCGKSSLVRAGLMPALLGGFLSEHRDVWQFAVMKPGETPLRNLARALLRSATDKDSEDDSPEQEDERLEIQRLQTAIEEDHTRAVRDYVLEKLGKRANLLLLVDQFEEIFAFRGRDEDDSAEALTREERRARRDQARAREEAAAFVDILVDLSKRDDRVGGEQLPIYTVLTMRTDFLGDCDVFYGLPEAMNQGRYLVPRLSRKQLRYTIAGPVRFADADEDAEIAPRLLDFLLNELGDRSDRLPVLQHALFRTYKLWTRKGGEGAIDLADFRAAGGLEGALSADAEEALALCGDRDDDRDDVEDDVRRIFRCLTDTDENHRRVRRPCSFQMIQETTDLPPRTIKQVLEQFRADGRQFIYETHSADETDRRVDISHESLIRQWGRLSGWVDDERKSRDQFFKLVDLSRLKDLGEASLLRNPELKQFRRWKEGARPTEQWARRYTDRPEDLVRASAFLERSVSTHRATRFALLLIVVLVLGSLSWAVVSQIAAANSARDAATAERNRAEQFLVALAGSKIEKGEPDVAGLLLGELSNLKGNLASESATKVLRAKLEFRFAGGEGVSAVFAGHFLVSAGRNGRLEKRDLRRRDPNAKPISIEPIQQGRILAMSSWPGHLVTAAADNSVYLRNLQRGSSELLGQRSSPALATAIGSDVEFVVSDRGVQAFGRMAKVLGERTLSSPAAVISIHPDGQRALIGTVSGDVLIWDWHVPGDAGTIELDAHKGAVIAASFSADGKYAVTASWDGTARILGIAESDREHGYSMKRELVLGGAAVDASFDPQDSSRLLTVAEDKRVQVWKWQQETEMPDVVECSGMPLMARFRPKTGATILMATESGAVEFWDSKLSKRLLTLKAGNRVYSAAFSADGEHVVTIGSEEVRVWRPMPTGDLPRDQLKDELAAFLKSTRPLSEAEKQGYGLKDM